MKGISVHVQQGNVSSNLQTDTVQSAEIKRLPGYAARLRVCVREIKGERKTPQRKCSQKDTD